VQPGDPDPLVDTATAIYHDFIGDVHSTVTASDSASVDLVHPKLSIFKTGDDLSKPGDEVNYTIRVCNSDATGPGDVTLNKISVTDSLTLPPLSPDVNSSFGASLAPGACESHDFTRTVQPGDLDPLVNTATARYQVAGLPNVKEASARHSVDLVHPNFTIAKTCSPDPVSIGGTITWEVTLTNTGDVALVIVVSDPTAGISETVTLPPPPDPGASLTITRSRTVTSADVPAISNTVTATATLDPALGLDNVIGPKIARASCAVPPPGEGCTPGFWKTHTDRVKYPNAWPPTGYVPGQPVSSVFTVPAGYASYLRTSSLAQALAFQGGSTLDGAAEILLRAAVAAVLNSAHPAISYPRTVAGIVADVNAALASRDRSTIISLASALDADNNLGCPISGK